MRKIKLLLISTILLFVSLVNAQEKVSGFVFNDKNNNKRFDRKDIPLEGISVSNGTDVVQTNKKGYYELPVSDDAIIFVIKPSGYKTSMKPNNTPDFYYIHKPKGSPKSKYPGVKPTGRLPRKVNFPLYEQNEYNKFSVLLFGDPQPRTREELSFFEKSIVDELINNKKARFGISLGDIAFDDLTTLAPYADIVSKIGLPWYNVMGNHDMNYDATEDKLSDETFEATFGPTDYSFNYGNAHFIILDNILYPDPRRGKGYWGGFRLDQLQFVRNDLKNVSKDKLIVISMHIPLFSENDIHFSADGKESLFKIIEKYDNVLILSAHTHYQKHYFHGKESGNRANRDVHEYNVGTTSGDWYSGEKDELGVPKSTMRDGTPRGYAYLNIDNNKYKISYKVYNASENYQMNVYMPKVVPSSRRTSASIFVNLFNGSEKAKVYYKIDDGKYKPMYKIESVDWNHLKNTMKWDDMTNLIEGRRPSNPIPSSHIWFTRFPSYMPVGSHKVEIKAINMFGDVFKEIRTFMVEKEIDIPGKN